MKKRALASLAAAAGLLAVPVHAQKPKGPAKVAAAKLDLNNPDDAVKVSRKIQSSLKDGRPVIFWFQGSVYSRVPGEMDRLLFAYQAMNIRATYTLSDPEKGYGYKMVSREVLLYQDPKTKEVLRTWKNPWTGQEVEVVHIANDPVNSRFPTFAKGPRGPFKLEATFKEGTGIMSAEVPLFYTNVLGGDYQQYVGGTYHAIELFNFFFSEQEALSPAEDAPNTSVGWCRVCQWLPWMEMGGRTGWLVFNGAGKKLSGFEALPEALRLEIEASYPEYNTPPPADDARPNETSWTYFKKRIEGKKKAAAPGK